jgi:hypothetical protein
MVPAGLPAASWKALLCAVMLMVLAMCGRRANALRLNRADDHAVHRRIRAILGGSANELVDSAKAKQSTVRVGI